MGSGQSKSQATVATSRGSEDVLPNYTNTLERESEENHDSNAEANALGSEEYFDIICVPCYRDGTTVDAFGYCCQCEEHLCALCYKYHKKATPSRHHKLLDKDAMPSTQRLARTYKSSNGSQQQQGQAISTAVSTSSYDDIKPKMKSTFCVRTSRDQRTCCITSMVMLPSDRLVLADARNSTIKLVNSENYILITQLDFGINLFYDITSTSNTQVAVTDPFDQQIRFINVTNKLSLSHTIQTNGDCYGICCYKDNLVVTYQNPDKLEILDMKGRVIASFAKDSTGTDILNYPEYVQANSSYIFVSNSPKTYLIMLNWQGKVIGRIAKACYESLKLLRDGSLLVCNRFENKVHLVAGNFSSTRVVLKDVNHLEAICVNDRERKLYISTRNSSKFDDKANNYIRVYEL